MTIYTSQNTTNEEKKVDLSVGDVQVDFEAGGIPEKADAPTELLAPVSLERTRCRRRRFCLQLSLFFLMIVGISVSVLGSVYLFRVTNSTKYSGFCGVRYTKGPDSDYLYLDEQVILTDDVETIRVPQFDVNDEATFVHDFARNVTLIKDDTDAVCYLMKLDRERIPAPQSYLELLYRIARGDYIPDAEEIQEDYGVVEPEVVDVEAEFGVYIAEMCADYETYRIRKLENREMATTTTSAPIVRRFGEYPGGEAVLFYSILRG